MDNTYFDDCMGNYTLYYHENGHVSDIYLQGAAARDFENDVIKPLEKIWLRWYGKGLRHKAYGPFSSYEEHLSYCISQYFY